MPFLAPTLDNEDPLKKFILIFVPPSPPPKEVIDKWRFKENNRISIYLFI